MIFGVLRADNKALSYNHRLTHIYLDTVPPTDIVRNDVATDKLTTQDGDKFRTGAGVVANVRATLHRLTPVLPRHTTTQTVAIRASLAI